jgi:hypothetical protein
VRDGMRLRRVLPLVTLVLISSTSFAASTIAEVDACPGYREHMVAAREQLRRGDRAAAIAELKRADEALRACTPPEETVDLG